MNLSHIIMAGALLLGAASLTSCGKGESYAKLLNEQDKAVNRFLADHRVTDAIPEDGDFEVGPEAPYYILDMENGVYMQVLKKGDMTDRAKKDDEIFFRYLQASLAEYTTWDALRWDGNAQNIIYGNYSFRYDNYSIPSSYQWGEGIQQPLKHLGIGCEVYLVVKSMAGAPANQANAIPALFKVTYYRSALVENSAE